MRYGDSTNFPYEENQNLSPSDVYGWSKASDELLIGVYHKNTHKDAVMLRFFSVYGPGGRHDMR